MLDLVGDNFSLIQQPGNSTTKQRNLVDWIKNSFCGVKEKLLE